MTKGTSLGARGVIVSGVEFEDRDPLLRNTLWEANPDPRPKPASPAILETEPTDGAAEDEPATGAGHIGAFSADGNWLEERTFFGPESDCDPTEVDDGDN